MACYFSPTAGEFSNCFASSLIYILNSVRLRLQPCLAPHSWKKYSVFFVLILTEHCPLVYIDLIKLYTFPPITLSIKEKAVVLDWLEGLLKIHKASIYFCVIFLYILSIRVCSVRIRSVVLNLGRNPIWLLLNTWCSVMKSIIREYYIKPFQDMSLCRSHGYFGGLSFSSP